jgi:hypothetical protein
LGFRKAQSIKFLQAVGRKNLEQWSNGVMEKPKAEKSIDWSPPATLQNSNAPTLHGS